MRYAYVASAHKAPEGDYAVSVGDTYRELLVLLGIVVDYPQTLLESGAGHPLDVAD